MGGPAGGAAQKGAPSPKLEYPGELPLDSPGCPALDQVGLAAVLLWLKSHRWIHRRAESMNLEDASVGSRTLRVSFTIPREAPAFPIEGEQHCCLPISLLRKHKVNLFFLTDEDHRDLPLLTREVRGQIAAAGLVRMASAVIRTALGKPLPNDIQADLELAAVGKPSEAISAMARMEGVDHVEDPISAACRALLMGHEAFRLLAWSLALNSMIIARLPYRPGTYHTLSAQYDEPLNETTPGSGFRRLGRTAFRTAGLTPKKLWFPARVLPQPSSNHYRVAAPDGLQISAATLTVEQLESPVTPQEKVASQPSVQQQIGEFDRWEERDRQTGSLGSIHLYDRELPEHTIALIRVNLRPTASGSLRAIWLTSAISVILLAITGLALGNLRNGGATAAQSASALLLLIPTVLAAYVARPGEHTLTSELLFGTRALGLVAGCTTLTAACYLVFTDPSRKLGGNWTVLLIISIAVFLVLTASFVINRAMAKPEGDPTAATNKLKKLRARAWICIRRRLG